MQSQGNHAANEVVVEVDVATLKKSVPWIYFVMFFAILNESMFNVSTPNIAEQFQLDAAGVSWVVTIFFIVIGLGMVIFGRLSDMLSVKSLINTGILLYTAGSILGFVLSSWYPGVLIARAIQGAGCSAIPALVFVIVARFFTAQERGRLFGMITSTASFAIGIGPVLGGFIAGSLHWSFLFLVPLPILVAIYFFKEYLPAEGRRPGRLDYVGTVLLGVVITTLILFTTEGHWLYIVGCLVSLAGFVLHIRQAKEPFVDPALFSNGLYRSGLIIGFFTFGTVISIGFVIPLMLHAIYELDSQTIGLVMFPGAFSAVIFGKVAGHLTVKKGSHFVMYLGFGLLALSLFLQSSSIGFWVWMIGAALVFMFIGFSFMQTALAESMTQVLPGHQIGVGMGFFNMVSTLAGAVMTALVAKAMEVQLFDFRFHPLLADAKSLLYGNLILFTCLLMLSCLVFYFLTFGRKRGFTARETV